MKKKMFAVMLAACMAASLAACGGGAADTTTAATEAATTTAVQEEGDTQADATEATEAESGAEEEKAAGGSLVMATNAEVPPYEYHDGDQIVGIDVEIAQAIAAEMGMELEIEDIAFDSVIPAVTSGKADFGAAGMTVTPERQQNVDFSKTYATAAQVIIVKNDSAIAGPADLEGKTIGVQLGTTGDLFVSDEENVAGATVERYNKGFEAIQALNQNKVDAVVIDGEPAKVFVSQNDGIKILDEALTSEEYAICVKKGNTDLLDNINTAITNLEESGKLEEIILKYIPAE